jgi:hypothetical protein
VRRAGAALWVACLAVCGGGAAPSRESISITLSLDETTCFICSSPDDCPLDCGGSVGIWAVDADTDEVLDSDCLLWEYTAGQPLRGLSDLIRPLTLDEGLVEGHRVVVEVATFYPETFEGCSRVRADSADGSPPHTDAMEFPSYFGRSQPTLLGEDPVEIDTPLTCVSNFACGFPTVTAIDATIIDIDRQSPPDAPDMLDVHTGTVFYDFGQDDTLVHAAFSFGFGLEWDDLLGLWHRDLDKLFFLDETCLGSIVYLIF